MSETEAQNVPFKLLIAAISVVMFFMLGKQFINSYQEQKKQNSTIEKGLMQIDEQLGWKISSNWQGKHHSFDYRVEYGTNEQGFRTGTGEPLNTNEKITVLGDSLSFGYGVNNRETFSQQLQISTGTAVSNASVPGYSTDQQYLQLKTLLSQAKLDISTVILSINLNDDLLDNALPQPLEVGQLKPFFTLNDKQELQLENSPVPLRMVRPLVTDMIEIAYGDLLRPQLTPWLRLLGLFGIETEQSKIPTDPQVLSQQLEKRLAPQLALNEALISSIDQLCKAHNIKLVLLPIPSKSFYLEGELPQQLLEKFYLMHLQALAKNQNIELITVHDSLNTEHFFENDGHLNTEGHHIISKKLKQVF